MAVQIKDKAITAEALKAVHDHLKALINALTSSVPKIDTTLKESGKVADAKATGDAISSAKDDIASLNESVSSLDSKTFIWGMLKSGFGYGNTEGGD